MRAYEERKAEAAKAPRTTADDRAREEAKRRADEEAPTRDDGRGDDGRRRCRRAERRQAAKLLPVTPMGRYVKVLLSSSEFLFID